MLEKQRTIGKAVSLSGVGLHTGNHTTVIFKPAPENHGIVFIRTDIPEKTPIKADIDNVTDLARGTTIAANGASIHTVEHVLSAIYGLQIDNILVEVAGNEPPVLDGSAIEFVKSLKEAGITQQDAPREYIEIDRTIIHHDEEHAIDLVIIPSDIFRVTYMIDYKNTFLGTQYTAMYDISEYEQEYAPSRTFCYLSETVMLKERNLIKGGTLDNAVVFIDRELNESEFDRLKKLFGVDDIKISEDEGILGGGELRFVNEPVRHKVVDLLGDLALLGAPLKGHVMAARAGHAAHVELARKVRKFYEAKLLTKKYQNKIQKDFVFDINAVQRILPHRFPFLLVDRIIDLRPGESVTGLKNVTINEPFFQGHFPYKSIMPGVLILEAMGQTGGVLLLNSFDNPESKLVYFTSMDQVKFRKPVVPGDQLFIKAEMIFFRRNICKIKASAYVGDTLVTEAILGAVVVDKDNP